MGTGTYHAVRVQSSWGKGVMSPDPHRQPLTMVHRSDFLYTAHSSDILNYSNNYNYHNYDIQNSMIDNICTERSAVQLASVGARSGSSQLYIDKI